MSRAAPRALVLALLAVPALAPAQTMLDQEQRLIDIHCLLLDLPAVQDALFLYQVAKELQRDAGTGVATEVDLLLPIADEVARPAAVADGASAAASAARAAIDSGSEGSRLVGGSSRYTVRRHHPVKPAGSTAARSGRRSAEVTGHAVNTT